MNDTWQPLQNVSIKHFSFASIKLGWPLFCLAWMYFCREKIKQPIISVLNLNMKLAAKKPNDEAGK